MAGFEWDFANTNHVAQHEITPAEAEQVVLNNPIDLKYEVRSGEERIAQVGETENGRILVVVTTIREERTRVVTAFPAKERIRNFYLSEKGRQDEGSAEEPELQE